MNVLTKPMEVGELVDRAIGIWRGRFWGLLALMLPFELVAFAVAKLYMHVARGTFEQLSLSDDPDPMSATLAESWRAGAVKEMERQNAALVAAGPTTA